MMLHHRVFGWPAGGSNTTARRSSRETCCYWDTLIGRAGRYQCLARLAACARRDTNIVDLLLPRLLAGETITRQAIVALGHGGLLS